MYCCKCGEQIPDDSTFCQFCGCQISKSRQEDIKEDIKIKSEYVSKWKIYALGVIRTFLIHIGCVILISVINGIVFPLPSVNGEYSNIVVIRLFASVVMYIFAGIIASNSVNKVAKKYEYCRQDYFNLVLLCFFVIMLVITLLLKIIFNSIENVNPVSIAFLLSFFLRSRVIVKG